MHALFRSARPRSPIRITTLIPALHFCEALWHCRADDNTERTCRRLNLFAPGLVRGSRSSLAPPRLLRAAPPVCSRLTWGQDNPEPSFGVAVGGRPVVEAQRRTAFARDAAPFAA